MEMKYSERGYLKDKYRIFYLTDCPQQEVPFHYHDFMKIFVLINGNAGYSIEGKEYELHPYDVVLVNAGEIHRPVIYDREYYERVIFYLSRDFFEQYRSYELDECFGQSRNHHSHVIRYRPEKMSFLPEKIMGLTDRNCRNMYAEKLLQEIRVLEFLILLNHSIAQEESHFIEPSCHSRLILEILEYINRNTAGELTVDRIADAVHLNRSYIMHKFKEETGYTIMEYVTEKRLFMANRYIAEGMPMTEVCYRSGFQNYSSFYRSYVDKYGYSPRKYHDKNRGRGVELVE